MACILNCLQNRIFLSIFKGFFLTICQLSPSKLLLCYVCPTIQVAEAMIAMAPLTVEFPFSLHFPNVVLFFLPFPSFTASSFLSPPDLEDSFLSPTPNSSTSSTFLNHQEPSSFLVLCECSENTYLHHCFMKNPKCNLNRFSCKVYVNPVQSCFITQLFPSPQNSPEASLLPAH